MSSLGTLDAWTSVNGCRTARHVLRTGQTETGARSKWGSGREACGPGSLRSWAWSLLATTDYTEKAALTHNARRRLGPHHRKGRYNPPTARGDKFTRLHRSGQIPPRPNKNTNWIYWIQGVCLNESLASFVFWFGRMMLRFLHENPLYTSCRSTLIVTLVFYSSKDTGAYA